MDGLIAYILAKKYADKVGEEVAMQGFKVQVEQDRSILETTGEEKVFYFLPKAESKPEDGYDEYIYANNAWEQVGVTDVDLSAYATQEWVGQQIDAAKEVYTGNVAPTGTQTIWIDTSQTPAKVKFKIADTWTDVVDIVTQGLPNADTMQF